MIPDTNFKSLARAITTVENELEGSTELLKNLSPKPVPVVGFTGPPGAGKSTLINAFLKMLSAMNKKVAVIAIDPSSPFNLGSLLADRVRMSEHFNNEKIFIRSVASRGSLGGLSEKIIEITDVLRSADFDLIIIETVGVGQSEVEIAGLADTTVVMVVPESGDEIQTLKSGVMEIADIFVVNKSDRDGAGILKGNITKMLAHRPGSDWSVPVLNTIATTGNGVKELYASIIKHGASSSGNQKKLFLLTEKAYQLIRNEKMKTIKKEWLKSQIEDSVKEKDFNLYRFVERFRG